MDRYQHVEVYDQENGSLLYNETIAPVGSNNRIEDADAISFWLSGKWSVTDALRINLAARYEKVESGRRQFADADRNSAPSTTSNDISELLPGASFTYELAPEWQLLGGVHKGFSPLGGGAKEFEEPETSTNWEAGMRYHHPILFVETIGFYSDFSNKAENCSVGSPCSNGETSGAFVTGKAVIAGVEFQASTVLRIAPFEIPLDFTYTYTDAEVKDGNSTVGVNDGHRLKDVPKNMASLRLGLEQGSGWNNYLVTKYMGNMCSVGGCNNMDGDFAKTDSLLVLDYISRYAVKEGVEVFFKVENLLDEQAIASRAPYGARPNQPRTALLGLELGF